MVQDTNRDTTFWAFTVVIEPDEEDGGYVVHCPELKGCWSQGETVDDAMHNIGDAISDWLATYIERSLDIARHTMTTQSLRSRDQEIARSRNYNGNNLLISQSLDLHHAQLI